MRDGLVECGGRWEDGAHGVRGNGDTKLWEVKQDKNVGWWVSG